MPRAIHKYGASAVGATPQFGVAGEHDEVAELRKMFARMPEVRGLEDGDVVRLEEVGGMPRLADAARAASSGPHPAKGAAFRRPKRCTARRFARPPISP